MKKIFTTLVLLSAMLTATQAQSLKFGLKGGLNITEMSFDEKVIDSSNKTGFFVGPTAQVSLPLGGLGVDISALYDQKESEVAVNDEKLTIKQQSILVPVNLRLKLGLGSNVGIYVAAGPQFGFNVGDDKFTLKNTVTDTNGTKENINSTFQLKKSSFSINLGAGVYLTDHLEVGFAYNIAVGKTGEIEDINLKDEISKTHANAWQISAAVYF